jgi:NAD(P)-dependent dehydrogenase (short-subunit alcohol dehydrogenase family)
LEGFENYQVWNATLIALWIHDRQGPPGYALDCYRRTSNAYLSNKQIRLTLFLVSDESRFINGAIIPADGGWPAA